MPTPIDKYLAGLPEEQRAALTRLRALLIAAVPGAEEAIKTRVPALRYKGMTVVGFGAAKGHVALYVMFGNALQILKKEFARFDSSNRVVRFTPEKPLPAALVRKVVRVRLAEIDARIARASAPARRRESRTSRRKDSPARGPNR